MTFKLHSNLYFMNIKIDEYKYTTFHLNIILTHSLSKTGDILFELSYMIFFRDKYQLYKNSWQKNNLLVSKPKSLL